jgi:hypothetical protein
MIQPFEIIECMSSMKYKAVFVSDSTKKETPDLERYNVLVEIDPWGKLVDCDCECKGFKFGKGKPCKHISKEHDFEPGLLQVLKLWKEIEEIPEIIEENE